MIDESEAQALGDLALERFKLRIDEFDDGAGLDVDHVVVMRLRRCLVAGSTITEVVTVENAGFLEKANGTIDCGNRDARVYRCRAFVEFLDIGMVGAFGKHPRDNAALFSDPQTTLVTKSFDVDRLMHVLPVNEEGAPAMLGRCARNHNTGPLTS